MPSPPGLVPSSGSSEELAPRALRLGSSESTFSHPLPGGTSSRSWGTDDQVNHGSAAGPAARPPPGPVDGLAHDLGDLLRVSPGPPLRGRAATEPATSSSGADGLLLHGAAMGGGGYPEKYTQF